MMAWIVEWTWNGRMMDTQFARQRDARDFERVIKGMEHDGENMSVFTVRETCVLKTFKSLEDATEEYGFQKDGPAT